MSYTPGPWTITYREIWDHASIRGPRVKGYGAQVVCKVPKWGMAKGDCESNAKLILAAPDLLDATKRLLELFGHLDVQNMDDGPDLGFAREAIQKATGAA